ncbi:MAG: DUF4339 domain-containing protein [Flavobacteriia bacterium]|nr:DUF4339 domain-containing protein [Flavobacteriia bacterium]
MEENWFIFKEDHHLGPFTADTLLTMLEEREVSENVLVWKEGFDAWLPALVGEHHAGYGPNGFSHAFQGQTPGQ